MAAHAGLVAMNRIAKIFLGVRDLMNTPLQNIELSLEILRNQRNSNQHAVKCIERALNDLQNLNGLLTKHEQSVEKIEGTISFDAIRMIEKEMREGRTHARKSK